MEHSSSTTRLKSWHEIAILFCLPFLLYAESYGFGLIGLDDNIYYFDSSLQGGRIGGLKTLWSATILSDYSPITQLTIWLDLALFGDHSFWGARLHNLVWFGLGTLAMRALLLRIGVSRGTAFAASLLYALHPLCAQSVLWLAERKHLVALALSLWALERYVAARSSESRNEMLRRYALALVLGVAALFAKPHAVALPVMIFAYEFALGPKDWKRRLLTPLPFVLAAAAFVAWNLTQVRHDLERQRLGGSLLAAVACDGPILWRYLAHLFVPTALAIYYYVPEHGADWLLGWLAWGGVIAVAAASVWLSRRRSLILFGWALALAALSPALNIVPQLAPMTDHYEHWALPGLLLAFCVLFEDLIERFANPDAGKRVAMIATAGAVLFFAAVSWMRIPEFRSLYSLFAAAVVKQSDSGLNWALYARALNASAAPEQRAFAGVAALKALESADADRILDHERMLCTVEAAVLLNQRDAAERSKQLVEKQSAILERSQPIFARITRARVALRTADYRGAIAALSAEFTPELKAVAAKLRETCRQGTKLPDELPPIADLVELGPDEISAKWGRMMGLSALTLLAEATLKDGKAEQAFDIAAVVVNTNPKFEPGRMVLAGIYRELKMPEVANRISGTAAQ